MEDEHLFLDQYSDQQVEESKEEIPVNTISNGRFLVFVNPASGKGYAAQIWNQAQTILGKTGYTFKVIQTEYSQHCFEYIHGLPLDELLSYKGIILSSGDGLPHEAINGLFTRKDWQQAKDIAFGLLPGGSGNAFAKTVTFTSELEAGVENCALIIAKGNIRNFDLMMFECEEGKRIFSFLSLAWSFIADIDQGSESMRQLFMCYEPQRFLGETRFTVLGTWRAIFQKKYPGKFYFTSEIIPKEDMDKLVSGVQPESLPSLQMDMGKFLQIKDELQYHWKCIPEKDYKYFLVAKQPYISEHYYAAPLCKIDDGLMDIQYLHSDDGWSSLVSLALSQEQGKQPQLNIPKGKHIDKRNEQVVQGSNCKYDKASAFRLEPSNQQGHFSIDGELYKTQRIQGVVLSNILKVFCF